MKNKILLRLLCATPLLAAVHLSAQTWQTVDDFQHAVGKPASALALGADASGNIYAAGNGTDAAGVGHALVMKSTDAGNSWATIQDFNYTAGVASGFNDFL